MRIEAEGIITAAAASGKGALIFSPAGNDSFRARRGEQSPNERVHVNSPTALAKGVISVSATEEQPGGLVVADYSNTGATLAAPGNRITGAHPGAGLTQMTGTSPACAVAAGTAALWWEKLRREGGAATVSAETVWSRMKTQIKADVFAPGVREIDRGLGLIQAPPAQQ